MKRCRKKLKSESELPDCVMSYIFSKLGLKDLVKTSVLSKRWVHEWGSRMDLNFDLHTMFDYNTIHDLPKSLPVLFQRFHFQSQFAKSLDQFMLHYQGDMIHSIRVNFPLGNEHGDVIDRLISKGIVKGVKRIELLFSYDYDTDDDFIFPYKFSLTLLSDNHSLTYLHLQNCFLVAPMNLSGFNNLRTLVLHLVDVKLKLLQSLCSTCTHLVDFTLDDCQFTSSVIIKSPTLLRLNIINCRVYIDRFIAIIASNLSSFEYSCNHGFRVHPISIKSHMLSNFSYRGAQVFKPIGFSALKNVKTIVLNGIIENLSSHFWHHLFSECLQLEDVTFKNCCFISSIDITSSKLLHLNIIDCGWRDCSPYTIAIDALNLSSFEYSGHSTTIIYVTAPKLLKVFWNASVREKTPHPFGPIETLPHIENLSMIISPSQTQELKKVLVRFQNLKELELFIEGANDPNMDYFWILDIIMTSQHLEKLSLTIRDLHPKHSHMAGFQRQKGEYAGFSHNDMKYVEFHGCVCSINVIELASHLLRSANSLKKVIFTSCDKFYIGAGKWTDDFTNDSDSCCWFGHNVIREMLNDKVNEQCRLIIL